MCLTFCHYRLNCPNDCAIDCLWLSRTSFQDPVSPWQAPQPHSLPSFPSSPSLPCNTSPSFHYPNVTSSERPSQARMLSKIHLPLSLFIPFVLLFFFIAAVSYLMFHCPLSFSLPASWGSFMTTGTLVFFSITFLAHGRPSLNICWMNGWTLSGPRLPLWLLYEPFILHLQDFFSQLPGCLVWTGVLRPVSLDRKHFLTFESAHTGLVSFVLGLIRFILLGWMTEELSEILRTSPTTTFRTLSRGTKIRQIKFIWTDWESRDLNSSLYSF